MANRINSGVQVQYMRMPEPQLNTSNSTAYTSESRTNRASNQKTAPRLDPRQPISLDGGTLTQAIQVNGKVLPAGTKFMVQLTPLDVAMFKQSVNNNPAAANVASFLAAERASLAQQYRATGTMSSSVAITLEGTTEKLNFAQFAKSQGNKVSLSKELAAQFTSLWNMARPATPLPSLPSLPKVPPLPPRPQAHVETIDTFFASLHAQAAARSQPTQLPPQTPPKDVQYEKQSTASVRDPAPVRSYTGPETPSVAKKLGRAIKSAVVGSSKPKTMTPTEQMAYLEMQKMNSVGRAPPRLLRKVKMEGGTFNGLPFQVKFDSDAVAKFKRQCGGNEMYANVGSFLLTDLENLRRQSMRNAPLEPAANFKIEGDKGNMLELANGAANFGLDFKKELQVSAELQARFRELWDQAG